MTTHHATYDPEDIESLMRQKTFDELYDDERNFVLQHISDENEYEEIRLTLLAIEFSETPPTETPKPETKTALLEAFKNQRTSKWLGLLHQVNAFAKGLITPSHSLFRYGLIPTMVLLLVFGGNQLLKQQEESNSNMEFASKQNYDLEDIAPTEEIATEEEEEMIVESEVKSEPSPIIESTPDEITSYLESEAPGTNTYTWQVSADSIRPITVTGSVTALTKDRGFGKTIPSSNNALSNINNSFSSTKDDVQFNSKTGGQNFMKEGIRLTHTDKNSELEEESTEFYYNRKQSRESVQIDSTVTFALFDEIDITDYEQLNFDSKSSQPIPLPSVTSEQLKVIEYLYTAF